MAYLLNPKVWAAIVLAILLGLAGAFLYRAGKATVRNDFDAYKLNQAEQRILADRAREHRTAIRQEAVNKEARDGQTKLAALETERDTAVGDRERMRTAIRDAARRAREIPRTASAGQGEPGADPIGMFSDLLERADRRAEAVAVYADRLRIAGSVCERGWDSGLPAR